MFEKKCINQKKTLLSSLDKSIFSTAFNFKILPTKIPDSYESKSGIFILYSFNIFTLFLFSVSVFH